MEYNNGMARNIFYLTLFAGIYFLLGFTGVFIQADSKLIGGLVELFTIPLIILLVVCFAYSVHAVLTRRLKPTFYSFASLLISTTVILAMFLVD